MAHRVTFLPANVTIEVGEGTTLMEAARSANVLIEAPCGGAGTCGRCEVIVQGAGGAGREEGRRLACQTVVSGDLVVLVPTGAEASPHILTAHHSRTIEEFSPLAFSTHLRSAAPTMEDQRSEAERLEGHLKEEVQIPLEVIRSLPSALVEGGREVTVITTDVGRDWVVDVLPGEETARNFGLAVDIGTTTVVATLIDLNTGNDIASASDYNRQLVCGEDILSRIAFAEENGTDLLQKLILETLDELIDLACKQTEGVLAEAVGREDITAAAISGNTVMSHLLLGIDPRSIRYEPYVPVVRAPPVMTAREAMLNIHPNAPVLVIPSIAGYVGGDITADIIASGMHRAEGLSLLIDVGTNGEIALGNSEWLIACSSSAGPAFEGGEVRHGMRAMAGAIDSVRIEDGAIGYTTIDRAPPMGICGSGLIDLIAQLYLHGMVDKKGHLRSPEVKVAVGPAGDITISDQDIQNIIRTKGAVYAACSTLLRTVGVDLNDIENVYVAGGFGNYLDIESAVTIGLLPDLPRERFRFLANASLAGARDALLSKGLRAELEEVGRTTSYLDLSANPVFFDEFSSALFIPHTEDSRFPSVRR